jgi:peroxiredoxin
MWHMGGHIFENLGRHRDAAWQQDASARIDHAYMMRDFVLPDQIHNYAHNNEWLVRSLSHVGRVDEGLELARNMIELPRHPKWNMPAKGGTSSFYGRMRLADTLQTFELWEELVALSETSYLDAVDYGEAGDGAEDAAHLAFALGEAHSYLGHAEEAAARIDELRALLAQAKAARAESVDEAEEEALACGADGETVRAAMDEALDEHAHTLDDLRDGIATLTALADVLAGNEVEDRLAELGEHHYSETALARLYAQAGRFGKAEELARKSLEDRAGQAEAYATLAHVLWLADERDDALATFEELRAISAELELDLPTFARLAPLAEAAGLPADWRVELVIPDDVGTRPDLATLGPRRWTPPAAPAWSAVDVLGATHTLADSSGRPRIVIFFLGFGCAHCVEQLQAFGPAAKNFTEAGIEIIAIGDNSADELPAYDLDLHPFTILADPDYAAFRAYRCYDDFEDVPLHGTFLIDGNDRIRWQDISFEPFTDAAFLLGESKRLLGLPAL